MDSALIDTKLIRANGQAGSVTITAPTIDMFDTKIRTQAFGGEKGDSGPVMFIATGPETISLVDSEIVTSAENGALNAGDITMTGPSVNVANTQIRAEAQESSGGVAGTIIFNVETVTFTDQSFVLSRNVTRTGGQASAIRIQGLMGPSSEAHVVVLDKQSRLQVSNEDASVGPVAAQSTSIAIL
ncbi:MAG: hypothetical protein D6690_07215 [Nitrospirae bacterium]|nr:MAG: hypothetical protein D6690_07215 [Nitrospirota bacterium]